MGDPRERRAFLRELGRYGALGFEMSLSVVIGLVIGYFLDKWLGTSPWLTILWVGFGFAAGVRSLYRAALSAGKDDGNGGKPGGG